jgi:pimeloyl-ACP methyl ester carboxylesterase
MKIKSQLLMVVIGLSVLLVGCDKPTANNRFFKDQPYNFQTLRALGQIPYGGADAGEVLATVKNIRETDDESWYLGWSHTAKRVEKMARDLKDPVSRGRALLRAHNYYRTAEFFLHPKDPRRKENFRKSLETFHGGLDTLGVKYRIITIPYGEHTLKAFYYPGPAGAEKKPLIVSVGGYDSTLEELYFASAAPALERGYSCLTYEGPGQGSVIREQGLLFTYEWEKPNKAVLDAFLKQYPKPNKIVLIGRSLGGYLAPRAAAFEPRVDGVVAFGVCYDFQEAALRQLPKFMKVLYEKWLNQEKYAGILNAMVGLKMKVAPAVRWGVQNAQWTMGVKDPAELMVAFKNYNLKEISAKISCDVLILAGERDHFFPIRQVEEFSKKLVNARSVTSRIFTDDEGGAEHCQVDAVLLADSILYDWIRNKFEKQR